MSVTAAQIDLVKKSADYLRFFAARATDADELAAAIRACADMADTAERAMRLLNTVSMTPMAFLQLPLDIQAAIYQVLGKS